MRFLGIDYGEKRVGIALSDESGSLAFPRGIFANAARLIPHLKSVCEAEHVGTLVVGESRTYRGEENPIMKKIVHFKKTLEQSIGVPVAFESETLSSAEARRPYRNTKDERAARKTKKKPMILIDDSSAAIILQKYIDKQKYAHGHN